MKLLDRIDGWWRPVAPAERLAAVRLLTGLYALVYLATRVPHTLSYLRFAPRQFAPVGVLSFLHAPPPGWAVVALTVATVLAAVAFVLGWRFRVTGPVCAVLSLWTLSYGNSWGQIFHTENALAIFLLVLAVTPSADALSLDARRHAGAVPEPDRRYGWPLRLLGVVVVATYFLAGVAKLRWGGPGWAGGEVLRDTIAADSLRKVLLGSSHSPVAELLLGQRWLFRGLAVLTLVVELGAPLALVGRRAAMVWAAAVVGFHLGVVALMAIFFPFPMSGVAFAPLFRVERLIERVRARLRSIRAARRRAS
jgi:hypothetical protein